MNRKNVALFAVLVLAAVLIVAGITTLGNRKETPVPAEPAAVETPAAEPEETTEPTASKPSVSPCTMLSGEMVFPCARA